MKLKDKIGSFLQLSDIPFNSYVSNCAYGAYPLFLLNKLYKTCIEYIKGDRREIDEDPLTVPYCSSREALENFKMFNLVDDVEKAVVNNLEKGIYKAVPIHVEAEEYIKRFSNTYFKFRREQLDCGYVITAFDSELCTFVNQAEIAVNVPYTPGTSFRSVKINKTMFIANEITALKRIKQLFKDDYDRIRSVIYALQRRVIKLRSTKTDITSDDLEL